MLEPKQKKYARRLANALEEAPSQDSEIEVQNQDWFSLINSSVFITCHADQYSETVLISQKLTLLEPGCYPLQNNDRLKSYFQFLDLDRGDDNFVESSVVELAHIRVSCDGLVLATMRDNESLILMNPVTRRHIALPLGTVDNFHEDLYGMAFCNEENTYKVVHFFHKAGQIGCEILNISTRKWTRMEGHDPELLRYKYRILVSVGGSLYWMLRMPNCDFFVSMNVREEKLVTKKLPVSSGVMDRLLEIGGSLGFVTRAEAVDLLQVWALISDGGSGENWIKRYIIDLSPHILYSTPICSSRNGKELVLEGLPNRLYVYNFVNGKMKLVHSRDYNETVSGKFEKFYIPHRNTLATWNRESW